jgi:hypothetical protein
MSNDDENQKPGLLISEPVNLEHEEDYDELNPYPTDTVDYLESDSDSETKQPKPKIETFEEENDELDPPIDSISKKVVYFEEDYEFYHQEPTTLEKCLEFVPSFQFSLMAFLLILVLIYYSDEILLVGQQYKRIFQNKF